MKGRLEVLKSGLFTTIQDSGRLGFRKYGIPTSGILDSHTYRLINWLTQSDKDTPVLEMTLQGGEFLFQSPAFIAFGGAEMNAAVNGNLLPNYVPVKVNKNDVLSFSYAVSGCRSYLAIHGEWEVDKVMNSSSTFTMAGIGGLHGRALEKGDILGWNTNKLPDTERKAPKELIPFFSSSVTTIRIIKGPEWKRLNEHQRRQFQETEYKVSSQSNRMGVRLINGLPMMISLGEMVSSAVLPGTVQLPEDGNPIILMQDGQTVGGYPRIAKVVDADLWRLAQLPPNAKIKFKMITFDEALELYNFQKNLYKKLLR